MSAHDENRIQQLLRQALPRVKAYPEPDHDLWPLVRHNVNEHLDANAAAQARSNWFWFDWALATGLVVVTVSFPASIPLLLYYL